MYMQFIGLGDSMVTSDGEGVRKFRSLGVRDTYCFPGKHKKDRLYIFLVYSMKTLNSLI